MAKIYNGLEELIGKTPLLFAKRFMEKEKLGTSLFAKLESFNPGGSAKDRIALTMIDAAEKEGKIKKGSTIIEPTSGNTGIGLAALAAARGYRAIFVMPETMSLERRMLLSAYGAEIVLTKGTEGMSGSIKKANELFNEIEGAFIPSQFTNKENPLAHYFNTGAEIWEDTDGKVDIFVASVGTGGTLSGTGKYLKEKNKDIKVVAVEPFDSPLLSRGYAGVHKIQGIGANFIPETLDKTVYDEVEAITTLEAYEAARSFAKSEGILVGISSGAVLAAAKKVSAKEENLGKKIVVLLVDSGERYLSTELYCEK